MAVSHELMVVEGKEQDFPFKNAFMCTVHMDFESVISVFYPKALIFIKDYESTHRV